MLIRKGECTGLAWLGCRIQDPGTISSDTRVLELHTYKSRSCHPRILMHLTSNTSCTLPSFVVVMAAVLMTSGKAFKADTTSDSSPLRSLQFTLTYRQPMPCSTSTPVMQRTQEVDSGSVGCLEL